ncbi:DUF3071 domain-containing protein [Propioniciclava coleopterorum]|uniref:DUF3071 domain-containing protein n=1 Tax=Propioniciclava coleopterorum TaxID=2714937 RepID=A0A6G7Y9Z1_9ACTN|nr:septation protein SepH [Propioniciclava coleopterorum]QIK73427.1 DUF3071 domain-containing protein [Propioniciclava coleopterorum]
MRPRDIQARIRAGESPADVAAAAGVPIERIAAFSDPVMAERDHVAGLARTHPVRRRGETTSHRTLRNAVADTLAAEGLDADGATWDAWKLADRRWRVQVTFPGADEPRTASFAYDQMGRFSVADDEEAKRLIGDVPAADDLALVRVTQDPVAQVHHLPGTAPEEGSDTDEDEREAPEDDLEAEDAFHEGDLAEVDGVYDIVPPAQSDLDVLYDMLSSFDEDSVKIYAGLVHPKEAAPAAEEPPIVEVVEVVEVVEGERPAPETPATPDEAPAASDAPAASSPAEPEQLSLLDEEEPEEPQPVRKRPKRKRAAVPSWDEIMFGAPRADDH